MADFGSNAKGGIDDRVRLVLGGDEVLICEDYHVRIGVFESPDAFNIRMGWGDVAYKLMQKYPPNTPFQLRIGDVAAMSGFTDGYESSTEPASALTIEGRDVIARFYDDHIESEKSFAGKTYEDLVKTQMIEVGLDPNLLVKSAQGDRQVRAGVTIEELAPPVVVDEILQDAAGHTVTGLIEQTIKSHIGERRLMFIRRYLDRAGLFIRAGADGSIILTAPNAAQVAKARIVRGRADKPRPSNVIGSHFRNNTRTRYSECVLYGRGHGGKKHGRAKARGAFEDNEMLNDYAHGGIGLTAYNRKLVVRDANVQTTVQAGVMAARKMAEGRREGWTLTYRLSGHTTPIIGGKDRMVWSPDTIVEVDDDEYNIHDKLYIESVEFTRSPQTETVLRLMRTKDLVFGGEE